jgi:hypothetical protein
LAYLASEQIAKVDEKLGTVLPKYNEMLLKLPYLRFKHDKAAEYMRHGYSRRVGTLVRCIDNVFDLIPMETENGPDKGVLTDAQINIQSFFANVSGCIDNLAWVWVYENELDCKLQRNKVGLRAKHKEVRSTLSADFQAHLATLDPWFDYIVEYRDALAHRIPLYVPPGGAKTENADAYNDLERQIQEALYGKGDGYAYDRLKAEQEKLLVFQPLITHSVVETTANFAFHVQMVVDFLTVDELGSMLLAELTMVR